MLKKVIALYIALLVALSGCVTVGVMLVTDYISEKEAQTAMKAENEVAIITDVFHDQTDLFLEPTAPTTEDEITIRIRTRRYNVTKAQIQFTNDKGVTWTTMDMTFEKHDDTGYYDWWKVTLPPQEKYFHYRFMLANLEENATRWYTLQNEANGSEQFSEPMSYSAGWFMMVGFDTPDWAKGTVWYSLIPDSFFNSDTSSDDLFWGGMGVNPWGLGRTNGLSNYYGGDLQGMSEKLTYLKSLGVQSVFSNPVHRGNQAVGYGAQAYKEVENRYGTYQTYKDFLAEVHKNGMHFMQDIDLAYVASINIWRDSDFFVTSGSGRKDVFTNAQVSGWGGETLDLGRPLAQQLIWTEEDSVLQYLVGDIGVDGFRFDTGGWLWGSTDTEDLSAAEVMTSIRYYLKKVNPEVFLLSESGGGIGTEGGFDSEWNRGAETQIMAYAEGLASASNVYNALRGTLVMKPRNVAFTLYNFTTQHDHTRVYGEEYQNKSAVALLYTFIGSPCIYYGEENTLRLEALGTADSVDFSGMEWNPTKWDYEMQNFYKAFGELRAQYTAVRTGAYKKFTVDDKNALITFARFDKNGAVLAAISQNEETIEVSLDARAAGLADGTVLTDWLTGKEYTVKDGQIIADVIPGGTAFVTGGKSSTFRQEYELLNVNASNKAAVYTNDDGDFSVEGTGKLGATDEILFAGVDTYNDFSLSAAVAGKDGEVAIMARNTSANNAAYYAAVVGKGKVTVNYRLADGAETATAVSVSASNNTLVRIVRGTDNTFKTYIATLNDDGTSGEWALVNGSEVKVSLNNNVKAGFAPISGKATITGLTRENLNGIIASDTFDANVYSGLFEDIASASNASIADGYLTVKPIADYVTMFTSNPPDYDFTFKTALNYAPSKAGDRAGVVVRGSQDEWVSAGRTVADGKTVFYFGKAQGGIFNVLYTVEDLRPNDEVIVQIQKIGTVYTAIYSYDGVNWYTIGDKWINMNFAETNIGILVEGTVDAKFNYASFGDNVNDGKSVNTPHTPGTIDMSFEQNNNGKKSGTWTNCSGTWIESDQGVSQTDITVLGKMSDVGTLWTGFRAQAVFKFDEGEGWAGIGFGKKSAEGAPNDGFLLKYTTDKTLALYKGDEKISELSLNVADGAGFKVVVEAHKDGEIFVYVGEDSILAMHLKDTGYVNGYLCYYTEGVVTEIGNYKAEHLVGNWASLRGSFVGTGSSLSVMQNSITNLTGVGVSNYVMTVKLGVNPVSTAIAAAQVTLSAPQGVRGDYHGVMLQLDQYGKVSLWEGGYELESYQMEEVPEKGRINCYIMVVKKNGTYDVYVEGGTTPVISYTEDYTRGGVISFSGYSSTCKFTNLSITNITSETNLTDVPVYADWLAGKVTAETPLPTHRDDFNGAASMNNLGVLSGDWVIKDGALHCTSANAWNDRVIVSDTPYDNFRITFDFKATGAGNWIGVSIRSGNSNADHAMGSTGGIMIYFSSTSGTVGFVDATNQNDNTPLKPQKYMSIPGYRYGQWATVTIEAIGDTVKVYSGGELIAECYDPYHYEGFIRFTSGMSVCAFDNLVIEPIVVA